MFCINCFYPNTAVTNSRPHKKQPVIWRRRSCSACGSIFTTTERPSLAHSQQVYSPSGETTPFNIGKLIISLAEAFRHDPAQADTVVFDLAQTIETHLATELKTITPEDIEVVAHQVLKRFDELAAVQYAAQHQLITSTSRRGRPSLRERERPTDASPSR
jgi:transcriptional repressor NrdR